MDHIEFIVYTCADPESFVRGGPTLTTFFLVGEGRDDPNTTKSGPSTARKRNGPTLISGVVAL